MNLGRADWLWDEDLMCHIPCCTRPRDSHPSSKCGNGPLNTQQILTGDCGEHEQEKNNE